MVVGSVKRAYRSTIRRGDAPALVCEAAHRLFSTKGYLATSIEDIAAEAGVARPTVFTAVGPKPVILRTIVDQALAGDDRAGADRRAALVAGSDRRARPGPVDPAVRPRNMCRVSGRAGLLLRALENRRVDRR